MRSRPQPNITPDKYVDLIAGIYSEKGDPETAEGQSRYMKERFPYYGLKAPQWVAILKDVFKENGIYEGDDLLTFVRLCGEEEYREMHYCGLQMLEKRVKKLHPEQIDFLEECALTNSWWDTVDWVNKLVGIHFKRYPELQRPTAEKWIEDDSIWLQRLATIHQLTFREGTDWSLMQEMILRRVDSKEFFVQKAQGWALRQYSKFNAPVVIEFIEAHPELSSLAKREGMKWLKGR